MDALRPGVEQGCNRMLVRELQQPRGHASVHRLEEGVGVCNRAVGLERCTLCQNSWHHAWIPAHISNSLGKGGWGWGGAFTGKELTWGTSPSHSDLGWHVPCTASGLQALLGPCVTGNWNVNGHRTQGFPLVTASGSPSWSSMCQV